LTVWSIAKGSLRYKGIALNPIELKLVKKCFEDEVLLDIPDYVFEED